MDVILAIVIFIVSYFFIMTERINRATAALFGGTLLLLTGSIQQRIYFSTILIGIRLHYCFP